MRLVQPSDQSDVGACVTQRSDLHHHPCGTTVPFRAEHVPRSMAPTNAAVDPLSVVDPWALNSPASPRRPAGVEPEIEADNEDAALDPPERTGYMGPGLGLRTDTAVALQESVRTAPPVMREMAAAAAVAEVAALAAPAGRRAVGGATR